MTRTVDDFSRLICNTVDICRGAFANGSSARFSDALAGVLSILLDALTVVLLASDQSVSVFDRARWRCIAISDSTDLFLPSLALQMLSQSRSLFARAGGDPERLLWLKLSQYAHGSRRVRDPSPSFRTKM
jgi:hypothetical protein